MHDALPALPEMPFHKALPELPFQNSLAQNALLQDALPQDGVPHDALPQKPFHQNANAFHQMKPRLFHVVDGIPVIVVKC